MRAGSQTSVRRPAAPLLVEDPTYDGARINGVRRRWHSLGPGERVRLVAPGGLAVGVDHPRYKAAINPIPQTVRNALVADLK